MDHVSSADGTRIAFEQRGDGPPIVIVVGAFCDRSSGEALATALARRFTVIRYDRRGRGDSGDESVPGGDSVALEVEDLTAVVDALDQEPVAYGHSSGGALALEAAARGVGLRRVAVYEAPYAGEAAAAPDFGQQLAALVADGRPGEAVERFLRLTGAPPPVIEAIKAGPGWAGMVRLAHTLHRDLALGNDGEVPAERLARIGVPVLALAGGAGAPWASAAARAIAAATPDGVAQVLEGQQHNVAEDAVLPVLEPFFAAAA